MPKMRVATRKLLLLLLLSALAFGADPPPDGNWWMAHFVRDLLPFWDMPAAIGSPIGVFPSTRCNDGSLIDYGRPCPEVNTAYLLTRSRYLVPLSRQVYGYGVAFHLTGDPKYLGWMKAGVDVMRNTWIDRRNGGMFEEQNLDTGAMGPAVQLRDPQQLGYGLLGLGFYYYLTRDPDVLSDIVALRRYILDNYYNERLGAMQWLLSDNGTTRYDQKQLVASLDQMNTYHVLLAPLLPEPHQSEFKASLRVLAHALIDQYYSPKDNLFFLAATTAQDKDINFATPDFGHTAKAMWMIRYTGLMTGDEELVAFSETNGRRLLERAYIESCGCWGGGVVRGGGMDPNKSWWVYAELDQFAGTLAVNGYPTARYLARAADYWFQYFVDHQRGEVWTSIDARTNRPPAGDLPKHWQWKSAYHSFEHALVGYITGQQLNANPVTLYYAFKNPNGVATIQPYYFTGTIDRIEPHFYATWTVYEVQFSAIK
jgi:mannose/cellobiose epimerase-like protein (N-acyl-D-glucosamine 2-epimerase family)